MPYEFPEELVEDLARQNCVVFVGAGVSAGCKDDDGNRPPTWKELILYICEGSSANVLTSIKERIDKDDYLTAAELALRHVPYERLYKRLEQKFRRRFHPSPVHQQLVRLAQKTYVTPNYDTILDTVFRTEFSEGVSVKTQNQNDLLAGVRSRSVLLIKNHGTIDERSSIVLTRSQYAKQRVLNSGFYRVLDALFLTRTILFIGCGTQDPDIELLMEDASTSFPGAPRHYMIKLRDQAELAHDEALEEVRNLRMIYYDTDHDQLPILLTDLVAEMDILRSKRFV